VGRDEKDLHPNETPLVIITTELRKVSQLVLSYGLSPSFDPLIRCTTDNRLEKKQVMHGSFLRRVGVTYVTFVGANALSNFILFPSYKLDYGILNRYLGRPVENKW